MNKKTMPVLGYILIIIIVAGICYSEYYFYSKYKKANNENQEWQKKYNDLIEHPEQLAKSEADLYYERVAKLTGLPADEKPKINTILDIDQLKDDEFFQKAQNGDKVLVFENSKLAIIYRPSEDKIINSGPLVVSSSAE
jgi:hypothetical protein